MGKMIAILTAACLLAPAAFGALEDLGGFNSTFQKWEFSTADRPAVAEVQRNPYATGPLTASIEGDPFFGNLQYGNGLWTDESLSVSMLLPNNPEANPYKTIIVEVKFRGELALSWVQDGEGQDFGDCELNRSFEDLADGWTLVTDVWTIWPNPPREELCYGFMGADSELAALDSIAVYTQCVPEPATLALLGLGMGFVARRRRNR